MTEQVWLTVVAPESMLEWVHSRCTERRLRLFAVACCRRVAHLCRDKFESIISQAEDYSDTEQPKPAASRAPVPSLAAIWMTRDETTLAHALSVKDAFVAARSAGQAAVELARAKGGERLQELWFQAAFLWDLVGNPFRSVSFSKEWRSETALAIARQMYESRDFSGMPILGDALQEAGCDNDDILNHCRDPHSVHVRGCWVIDLVLGKA